MGRISLTGEVSVQPDVVSDTTFPGAVKSAQLSSTPTVKSSTVDSGIAKRLINSPNAFLALSGVGTNDDVTRGDTLYIKSNSPIQVRLTFAQISGGDLVSTVPLFGTCILEIPSDQYLKTIEAKGAGTIEYLISGSQ